MTPAHRQQILDYLNEARGKLENGQLFLTNGKYALQAESMPELTWDCEIEEGIYDWLKDTCDSFQTRGPEADNMTWGFGTMYPENDDKVISNLIAIMLPHQAYYDENQTMIDQYHYPELSRHNLYLESPYAGKQILAFSDKAQRIGCAINYCNVTERTENGFVYPGYSFKNVYCQLYLTQDLKLGDELYKISPSVNYIPPTQDVICPYYVDMTFEDREAILEKINLARSKISQGTYQLGNGNTALQSVQPLSPLVWSCEDELALRNEKGTYTTMCPSGTITNAATEFEKIVSTASVEPINSLELWKQMSAEFYVSNPNLNFLSQSTSYSTEYPAAFALSNQAESIACYRKQCWNLSTTFEIKYTHICRVKPSVQINDNLYQV
uniref:SCP domain-containing protein n=1 Tax=Panagrolaimus davidi TaxID=227884 RepID=A0A914QJT6_9BILA